MLNPTVEVEILGVVLGKCYDTHKLSFFTCINFSPNETMYKIFPDFPKKVGSHNNLHFDYMKGKIKLEIHTGRWETFYEKYINLSNFKGN